MKKFVVFSFSVFFCLLSFAQSDRWQQRISYTIEVEMNVEKEKDAKLSTIQTQNKNQQNAQKNSKISPPLGRKIFKVNSIFFQYNL